MATYVPPKKNTALVFYTALTDASDTTLLKANPTIAISGDVKVSKDGGAFADLATTPDVYPAAGYAVRVQLSADEMNADNIVVYFHDAVGAEWCDQLINIQTAAQQVNDLASQASVDVVDGIVDSILVDTGTDIPASVAALNDLDAAGVRTAVGLAAANLDTQIGTLATGAEVAAAEAAIRGADGDTLETLSDQIDGVPAANWAYGTRTLTMTAAEIESSLSGDTIAAHRGDSMSQPITGMGSLAGYVSLDFTVKRSKNDSDDDAIIRIRKTASGVGGGLLRLNGAEATAGDGSLVIDDEAVGNVTVNLAASAMAQLTAWSGYHYDVQEITATAVYTKTEGLFVVPADVTRAVV